MNSSLDDRDATKPARARDKEHEIPPNPSRAKPA